MSEKKTQPDQESKLSDVGELDYPEDFGWPESSEPRTAPAAQPASDSGPAPELSADLDWPEDIPALDPAAPLADPPVQPEPLPEPWETNFIQNLSFRTLSGQG